MKRLFKKTWFQIIFFGIIIGALLIFIDTKSNLISPKKPEVYSGIVKVDTDDMYFTKALFEEVNYDFGKVKEGDTVIHKFIIKNTGTEPLMIYKTKGSCDCIRAYYSDKPILPDSTGVIGVYFKTIGRKGHQLRTVNIHTNTDPSETLLTLTGDVE